MEIEHTEIRSKGSLNPHYSRATHGVVDTPFPMKYYPFDRLEISIEHIFFQHIIFLLAVLVSSAIPYISEDVKIRTKKEQILTQELFMKAELGRSRGNILSTHIVRPRSRIVFVN